MLVKYVSIDGIPQAFLSFRFVDMIIITVHDRFWNVGQANCILKYFRADVTTRYMPKCVPRLEGIMHSP
jgi:hypothetical protein